ncbi:Sulfotransferase family protein [compost metagenome]
MHIPKTGGVSFRRILEDNCKADQILHVVDTDNFSTATIDLSHYRLIHGHLSYAQISSLSEFSWVISLRDPVSRCLSTYNFWRDLDPEDSAWSEDAREHILAAHTMSLENLIDHPSPSIRRKLNNYQTWLLSGESDEGIPMQEMHLKAALENLEKFDFIALSNELSLSTHLLCLKFGMYSPEHTSRLNISRSQTELTPQLRKKIEENNKLDYQLMLSVSKRGLLGLNGMITLELGQQRVHDAHNY